MIQQHQLIDHAEIGRRAVSLAAFNEQPQHVPLLLAGSPGVPDLLDVDDVLKAALSAFVGFQPLKPGVDSRPPMAFLMKSKYVDTVVTPDEVPYTGMAFSIDKADVELGKPASMKEWRRRIVSYLIENAEPDLLWTDRAGGIDATIERLKKNNPDSSIAVSSAGIMIEYENSLKFNLQRKMSAIAKVTRRGMGNRLIGSRSAVEELLEFIPESQQSRLKIIIFEDGEIQKDPWLLVGYNGTSPYDTGLAFVYKGNSHGGQGALVDNDVKRYWRRLI